MSAPGLRNSSLTADGLRHRAHYCQGMRRPPFTSVAALLVALAALGLLLITGMARSNPALTTLVLLAAFCAVAIGLLIVRRDRIELRKQEVQAAVATERLAIARDLHDIVSHGLGMITLSTSVAAMEANSHDCALLEVLRDVETVSRSTTLELRRMMHVLRGDSEAPLAPTPGIPQIPELIEHARAAGLTVTLDANDATANSEGVSVAAYRLVQEALTNVARHAGPATVAVRLGRSEDCLKVRVQDFGRTQPMSSGPGRGFGLLGLQERVAALDGTVMWGKKGAEGFIVTAEIPDPPEPRR